MPVRKATPEETLEFWGTPVIVVGQKRPDPSKKNLKSSDQKPPQKIKVSVRGICEPVRRCHTATSRGPV